MSWPFRFTARVLVMGSVAMFVALSYAHPTPARALSWTSDDLYIRVVDVGAGLCTVTVAPEIR